jgi:outer membrane protein OmpA-like peptidoglycan-associated protein
MICLCSFPIFGQKYLNGLWQGILIGDTGSIETAQIIYLHIEVSDTGIIGTSREEKFNTSYFITKSLNCIYRNDSLILTQRKLLDQDPSQMYKWCLHDFELKYVDSTGYLIGEYASYNCTASKGKVVLYRSKQKKNISNYKPDQSWYNKMISDYQMGLYAPDIRDMERINFVFQPIYFDHDKAEIKPEYEAFLRKMARVVKSHSDLRIKVTGHTDAVGSDIYNIDLSERRAKAITEFFIQCGLDADRIEIDFKGERIPVDTNTTPEGKQKNRRVDFCFI